MIKQLCDHEPRFTAQLSKDQSIECCLNCAREIHSKILASCYKSVIANTETLRMVAK